MSWLSSDRNIWLIASFGLSCPPLPSGGLLGGRGHLASLSVVLVSGLGRSQPHEPEGPVCLLAVHVLGCSEICVVPVVIQDLYCVLSPFQDMSPFFRVSDN